MDNGLWDYNELLAFVLIHASHADLEFSVEEENTIKKEVGEDTFGKMNEIYNQGSEYQNLQKILNYKDKYFSNTKKRKQFLSKLEKQFQADGEFSRLEKTMLQFLEMMISV